MRAINMDNEKFTANNIPLEVDVWNVIKKHLYKDLRKHDVLQLHFKYSLGKLNRIARMVLTVPNGKTLDEKDVSIEDGLADDLVSELCKKFNIPNRITRMEFTLKPAELPVFSVDVYPYVNHESELDTNKSRKDVMTIN